MIIDSSKLIDFLRSYKGDIYDQYMPSLKNKAMPYMAHQSALMFADTMQRGDYRMALAWLWLLAAQNKHDEEIIAAVYIAIKQYYPYIKVPLDICVMQLSKQTNKKETDLPLDVEAAIAEVQADEIQEKLQKLATKLENGVTEENQASFCEMFPNLANELKNLDYDTITNLMEIRWNLDRYEPYMFEYVKTLLTNVTRKNRRNREVVRVCDCFARKLSENHR